MPRWSILLFLAPGVAIGQTTGSLNGRVTDGSGSPLAGVTIQVTSAGQGIPARGTLTDARGVFRLPALPVATDYVVRASLPGFAPLTLSAVRIAPGDVTTVTLALLPESSIAERVEVRARPRVVDMDNPTRETGFSAEFIDALPLLGRNYQDVLALAPGVSDLDGDGNPNIHGARDTDVVTLVDGVSTTDPLTGKVGAQLNIESIQEIEIKTSGATAEFGRAQGGFANIVTKSGGNEFGGTFKFFWRGSALDGDGAGADDPRLHAGVGDTAVGDLTFNDYLPFLSLEGPIVRDRAWFFVTLESVQLQEPVNALSTAFVRETRELRGFAKATWQASPNNRLVFWVNYDPQEYLNQGLNSFTPEESGFTTKAGGTVVTFSLSSVLGPLVALDTTLSAFDGRPELVPNLGRDLNDNGRLYYDRNRNGFNEASERDPGEDYNQDGVFAVFEDLDGDGVLDPLEEDRDLNGRATTPWGCEGDLREDVDCDGHLDNVNEDKNGDGIVSICNCDANEDLDGDRRLDTGIEDRNGNGVLDDTPYPGDLYPYGRLAPEAPDRDYMIDQSTGVVHGPYYEDFEDRRRRVTWREDLSVFVPDRKGTHDVKAGLVIERETFERTTRVGDVLSIRGAVECPIGVECSGYSPLPTVKAILHTQPESSNEATSVASGLYVQDHFKPLPNLSIGFGLRFDREQTDSFGYSFFDPALERLPFDRLTALSGREFGLQDYSIGNNDGLNSQGILGDPIFPESAEPHLLAAPIADSIYRSAIGRLTRHHSSASFGSTQTGVLFGGLFDTGDRLNLQELAALGILPQSPERFRLTNNNLSPRLSVSWDPDGQGRTRFFATWGRYYDKLFLGTIVTEREPDNLTRYYTHDPTGLSLKYGFRGQVLSGTPNHYTGTIISKSPPSTTQVDRGLSTPYSDEWTLGFDREIAPEVALSVAFIQRRFRDQLQDVDVNHELRYDPYSGLPLDILGRNICFQQNPVFGVVCGLRLQDGRPDLYVNNFFFNEVLRIGNYNEARYNAIEVQLRRRLLRRWGLQTSYTYSRAQGDAEDFQSRLGNDPSTIEAEYGYLDFDQRHVVKLNGMVFLPRDWQLGTTATWGSGLPYSIVSRFFALDNIDMLQYRTRYGRVEIIPGEGPRFVTLPRNSERNEPTFVLNLSVRKNFVIGRAVAAASLEVFNVLNTDDLRIYTYEPDRGDFDFDLGDPTLTVSDLVALSSPLQIDGERSFGRRFQVGFQIDF